MATIDYSKYGAKPEVDYSKYGAVAEQSPSQPQQNPSYLGQLGQDAKGDWQNAKRLGGDVLSGLAEGGQGLHNAPYNIANLIGGSGVASHMPTPTHIDFNNMFGVTNPGLQDKLVSGVAQYAPYALGGEAALAEKIPSLLGRGTIEGSTYGATQSDNPASGTIIGGLAGLGGGIAGKVAGTVAGIPGAIKDYLSTNSLIKEAPEFLNKMAEGVSDRANMPLSLKDSLASLYKENQKSATKLSAPLNNSNAQFYVEDPKAGFKNYINSAKDLLENRATLNDLFGSDTSLGAKLNKELDIADTFTGTVKNGKPSIILNESGQPAFYKHKTVDFQDIWQRLKDLGQMQAKASGAGARNEARVIGNLRGALSDDLQANLKSTGNGDLAQQLKTFNNFYKNKVAPIYDNTTISKAAQMPRYVPDGPALAKALHAPSIGSRLVFDQLSPKTKNAAAYQLITGGKGTAQGLSNMTAEDIGKSYGRLNSNVKSTIASHNPEANAYFENLSNIFSKKPAVGLSGLLGRLAEKATGIPVGGGINYMPKNQLAPNFQNALGFGITPAISNAADSYFINGGR